MASGDSTFNAGLQRTYGAGVNYAFGAANVGLVFTQTQLHNATSIRFVGVGHDERIRADRRQRALHEL